MSPRTGGGGGDLEAPVKNTFTVRERENAELQEVGGSSHGNFETSL